MCIFSDCPRAHSALLSHDFLQQQAILEQESKTAQQTSGTCAGLARVVVLTIKLQSAGEESVGIVQGPSCHGGFSRKHESAERPPATARIKIAYTYVYIYKFLIVSKESITKQNNHHHSNSIDNLTIGSAESSADLLGLQSGNIGESCTAMVPRGSRRRRHVPDQNVLLPFCELVPNLKQD